ncbi:transporter [Halostagnicola larsenii XH-48]|uniref:Transporter n=1 Tax=Halostagnicola larsenii XH-48 TaxID=797299 RepID=W0JSF3_9EURY|nr:RDD family protein [Halostagnicola larsenii]AHG00217.1 transporter [Halostagnicola larsenii XH-48]
MTEQSAGYVGTQDDVILGRVGAFVLDYILSLILGMILGFGLAIALDSVAGVYLGMPIGLLGYYILLEGATGQTLGKRLAGVIVVSRDGSSITFRQALVRNLLRIVDGILSYAVGLVVMLVSDDRQRVGDHAANTLVVRSKR